MVPGVSERRVTLETLGAWVIKCNPGKTPVAPMREAGEAKPLWCVADNYRTRLIKPDQRALFWVTSHPRRGIWGAGRIIGNVFNDGSTLHVPVHIPLLAQALTAAELSTQPGLRSMEVFRSPQQANPSWVSVAELKVIDALLPHSTS